MKITLTQDFDEVEEARQFLSYVSRYKSDVTSEQKTTEEPAKRKTSGTGADPKDGEPKSRRRGRPAANKEVEEKPATRGGRRAAKETPPAEISDSEIAKATSEAAKNLTVEVVLDELHEYDVDKVSELDQPQRVEFMARLRDLLNDGPGGAEHPAFG